MMLSVKDIDSRFENELFNLKKNEPDIYAWFVRSARKFGGFDDRLMDFLISLSIKSVSLFSECLKGFMNGLDTDYLGVYYDIFNKHGNEDDSVIRHDFLDLLIDCSHSSVNSEKVSDTLERCNYDFDSFSLALESQIYLNDIVSYDEITAFLDKVSSEAGDNRGKESFNLYLDVFQNGMNLYGGLPSDVFDYLKEFSKFDNGSPKYMSFSEPLHNVFIFLVNRCASSSWFRLGYELYQHALKTQNYYWVNIIDSVYCEDSDAEKLLKFLNKHEDLKYPYLFIRYSEKLKAYSNRFNNSNKRGGIDYSRFDDVFESLDNVSFDIFRLSDDYSSLQQKCEELEISVKKIDCKFSENISRLEESSKYSYSYNDNVGDQIDAFGGFLLTRHEKVSADKDIYDTAHSANEKESATDISDNSANSQNMISDNTEATDKEKDIISDQEGEKDNQPKNLDVSESSFVFHNSNEAFSRNSFMENPSQVIRQNDNSPVPENSSDNESKSVNEPELDSDGNKIVSFSEQDDEGRTDYENEINDAVTDLNIDYKQQSLNFHRKYNINNSGNVYLQRKFEVPVNQSTSSNGNSFFDRMARHILFANFVSSVPEDAKLKSIYGFCVNDPHFGKKSLLYIGNIAKTNLLSMDELFKYLLKYPSVDELKSKYEGLNTSL